MSPGLAPGAPAVDAAVPDPPTTDLSAIAAAVESRGAAGFVAVGDRFDDDLRYLSRFGGPDRAYALVVTPERAVLTAPALFDEQARREFVAPDSPDGIDREVRTAEQSDPAGVRAARVLNGFADDGVAETTPTVLTPASIPHDAALYLAEAGYEPESTTVVADTRRRKTDAELACLRRVQAVACRGMARAEAVLAEAEPDGDDLLWAGEPLTTERLRRAVDAEMARHGLRSAGNTVIGAGPTAADLHYTGIDHIAPGETVLLDISPRGPHGYYGDLTRTFVVESEGGWERRAFVAVEDAHEMALTHVEAGVTAGTVNEEAAAELAAHGFRVDSADTGFTHGVGHGVGVSLHEGPSLTSDDPLEAGHVVTIEPGVYDPEVGGVRIEDLVVVTEDGYERLASYPVRFTPSA
ncbi:MAG: M24 family metallopeptidase [Halolamina sp.]